MNPEEADFKKLLFRLKLGAYGFVALLITVVAFPMVHGVLYKAIIGNPGLLQWGGLAVIMGAVASRKRSAGLMTVALAVFVVMGLVGAPIIGGVYAHSDMANQMQTDAEELQTLPNTSQQNVRVLPRSVSDNYAQSSMQYPQFGLTESDITYRNGSYAWSHGLRPDNPLVALLGNQKGALYVNMTTTEKQVSVEETEFKNGRGQVLFDSYQYQSVLHSPLKMHNWPTTFNARANGTSYIAHSTTTYDWRFRMAPIPQVYAVPQHGSVEVMYADGDVESLSPSEARQSSLLEGQNYYPYHLAMFKVESMQYVHGALNKWFWKEDVLAIADLPEEGNNWPLTVPTEGSSPELTYFIATEPTGSGNGVYEIWTVDSQTGEAGVKSYEDSQIGPEKAVDFVERHPDVNRLSNAEAVSPIPVVNGDDLYWHVKVVPGSRSGVVYTAFVDASSGGVTLVEGTAPIYAFLSEGEFEEAKNQTSGQSSGRGVEVTVLVTDDDGDVVRTENITVPEGGNVEINVNDQSKNSTEASA